MGGGGDGTGRGGGPGGGGCRAGVGLPEEAYSVLSHHLRATLQELSRPGFSFLRVTNE